MFFAAFLNSYSMSFKTVGDWLNSFLTVMGLLICFNLPLFVFIKITNQADRAIFETKRFKIKYGALYAGLNTKRCANLIEPLFFLIRRVVFITIACLWHNRPLAQVTVVCLMQFIIIVYLAGVKPFETPVSNKLQLFNEFSSTCLFSFVLGFANPGIDGLTRFRMGSFCITIIILTLITNACTCSMRLWYDIMLRIKRCCNVLVSTVPNSRIMPNDNDALIETKLGIIDEEEGSNEYSGAYPSLDLTCRKKLENHEQHHSHNESN